MLDTLLSFRLKSGCRIVRTGIDHTRAGEQVHSQEQWGVRSRTCWRGCDGGAEEQQHSIVGIFAEPRFLLGCPGATSRTLQLRALFSILQKSISMDMLQSRQPSEISENDVIILYIQVVCLSEVRVAPVVQAGVHLSRPDLGRKRE